MSLRPQPPLPPVPDDTARVAQTAFQRGNPYLLLRTRLGTIFADAEFADLFPTRGQPAYAPWRLALVTLLQFRGACRKVFGVHGSLGIRADFAASGSGGLHDPQRHRRAAEAPGQG